LWLKNSSEIIFKNCDRELYQRLMEKMRELSNNPFPQDIKRVEGEKGKVFRIRVGKLRITYEIYTEKNEILIVNVGKRPNIYD